MKEEKKELCEFLYFATTACNYRCKHCHPNLYTKKKDEMSSKLLIERYEKSKYLQENSISIGGGEPFMKDDLDEFVVYLDKKKIPCIITTNGRFTDRIENLINQLEDTCTVKFAVSIDGIESVHNAIRGGGEQHAYQHAYESVKLLKERGFQVQINMVVQKDNMHQLEAMAEKFKQVGASLSYIPKINCYEDEEFELSDDDIRKVYDYFMYERERKLLLSKGKFKIQNCHAASNTWLLDSNGDVYACGGCTYEPNKESYRFGNLVEDDFDDIFTSQKKADVYENIVKPCAGCAWPRDIDRETAHFGLSTKLTKTEASIFESKLKAHCDLDQYSVDNCNWNDLEENGSGTFRWMKGKSASLFLKVPNDKIKTIELKYLNLELPGDDIGEVYLNVTIDETEIGKTVCEKGVNTISLPVNFDSKDAIVEIKLESNLEWCPADIHMGSDDRKLGLAIYYVALK